MALTPMMRQYLEIKERNKDCILFYRLGDFYEMFFEDALTASKELEITLTGRDCGLEERAPMCGVPYHAAEGYIARLVEKGYKVAICEQMELPEQAKGIVRRDVVRIITPGTVTESSMLAEDENSYILSIYADGKEYGAAYADISTGAFYAENVEGEAGLSNLILRVQPKEVLYQRENDSVAAFLAEYKGMVFTTAFEEWPFQKDNARRTLTEHFTVSSMTSFGFTEEDAALNAAGALLQYMIETQKNALSHIKKLVPSSDKTHMVLDGFTHRNLELTENMSSKKRRGSLLWLLDKTKTAMGSRLLKQYIEQPLIKKAAIAERLDAVGELKDDLYLRNEFRNHLDGIYDIERLLSRISYGTLNGRDALAIKHSIEKLPALKALLLACKATLLKEAGEEMDALERLFAYLDACIAEEPPLSLREGGIIKSGFSVEVDKLRDTKTNGNNWLRDLEERERESTGIKTLKIKYNKVFGYFIEITKSNLNAVPYRYTRKQTLANSERFITPELKELEELLLTSDDKLSKLEYELFLLIREKLEAHIPMLQKNADLIAKIDVMQSYAQAAYDYGYVKPTLNTKGVIEITGGRHPVVERSVSQEFVPNDAYMDTEADKLLIITGPNMAGKSTFMRQTGLIVLMAQIGSFVPAAAANIGIVDRIFTRVGASDDLSSGQSTFMVEMNELASILNNATKDSLLILDEIGRGTSTLDGLSIAWATIEHILSQQGMGAKTLFATHYHELVGLEGVLDGVKNYSVSVKEFNKSILFLHKIRRGGTDKSFGIEVAKLAGLPESLTNRAKALLAVLESHGSTDITTLDEYLAEADTTAEAQDFYKNAERIITTLRTVDINALTPLEALSILNDLIEKV